MRLKKIAIGNAAMPGRSNLRCAAQYFLVNHKLTVVLANSARRFGKTGVW